MRNHDQAAALLDALLRQDFMAFLHKAFETVSAGDRFLPSWHLEAIGFQLEQISNGKNTRLIVSMPPRYLKSITISVAWVAWQLGHDPSKRFVCVSYSSDLAQKHANDCRAIMQSDWYRRIFPKTVIPRGGNSEMDFRTTKRGGRFSTSVGGTLTGRGGDIIIIDDPLKPEEAMSALARKKVQEWYANTLSSRLNDKRTGVVILVMQRLHEDDLAGHFLEAGGWAHLCLPAIAETPEKIQLNDRRFINRKAGDALHPEREPVAQLDLQKRIMGSAVFSAQYQQAPVPAEGTLVQRAWFQRYKVVPEKGSGSQIVQSWDTASKEGPLNDWSVCVTALVRGRRVYVIDVFRAQLTFPALRRKVEELANRYRTNVLLIEDASSGAQLIQQLRVDAPQGVPLPIARKADGDKITRFSAQTVRIENGELQLPEEAPWLDGFERELLGFPNTRHDDQVDALTQLLAWSARRKEPVLLRMASERQVNWAKPF